MILKRGVYSRETSRPKMYDFIQSMKTRIRLRAVVRQSACVALVE